MFLPESWNHGSNAFIQYQQLHSRWPRNLAEPTAACPTAFRRGSSLAGAFRGGEMAAGSDPGAAHIGNAGLPCISCAAPPCFFGSTSEAAPISVRTYLHGETAISICFPQNLAPPNLATAGVLFGAV
jgi:hypothetical protein